MGLSGPDRRHGSHRPRRQGARGRGSDPADPRHCPGRAADATTAGLLEYEVKQALRRWEPRIEIMDVDVGYDPDRSGVVYIEITYRIRTSNDPRNLVFPF